MFKIKSLALLKSLPLRPEMEEGKEMALVEDESKIYQYKDGDWVVYDAPEGFSISLLELNSMAVTQLNPLTRKEIRKAKAEIRKFTSHSSFGYYMLLSNELKYYTIFNFNENYTDDTPQLEDEVIECAKELGKLKSIVTNDDSIELWITVDDKSYPLYFFDYSGGVIQCR